MNQFLFDLDDTLYDQFIPFEQAYRSFFATHDLKLVQQVYAYSRIFSDEVFEQTQKQLMSLNEMHSYRLTKAFEKVGIIITPEIALGLQKEYAAYQRKITLSPEMQKILTLCTQEDRQIGIITNGPEKHQWGKLEALGITRWVCTEHIFISGALALMKPDPRLFNYAAKQMGLVPTKSIYVGDSFSNDVVGAKKAGWTVIWFNRRHQTVPEGNVQADYIVNSEMSLYQLIQQITQAEKKKVEQ